MSGESRVLNGLSHFSAVLTPVIFGNCAETREAWGLDDINSSGGYDDDGGGGVGHD